MPRIPKQLNSKQVEALAAKKKSGLYRVGGVTGLSLQVRATETSRSASWLLRIKIGDKMRSVGLGGYTKSSLARARDTAEKLRFKIKFEGLDPFQLRKDVAEAERKQKVVDSRLKTFEQVAEIYLSVKQANKITEKQLNKIKRQLELYAYPGIGNMIISEIMLTDISDLLMPIWETKHDTANRTRIQISKVFDLAIASSMYTKDNPARWVSGLETLLPDPKNIHKVTQREALHVEEMPLLWKMISSEDTQSSKVLAFIILTACRQKEASIAEWSEIDFKEKTWTKPASSTKNNIEHQVPLSSQVIKLLESTPRTGLLIFPNSNNQPLTDVAITKAHRKHGFIGTTGKPITTHGFRSTFKDWSRLMTNFDKELSELQLQHSLGNSTYTAYARDTLVEKRRLLVQEWGNYCQKGKQVGGDNVRAIGS